MQGNLEASSLDVLSAALDLARVGLARWDTDVVRVPFEKRWFRVAERRTPDGGAVGVYIDVTEERRNELMAREGERHLRLLFENMYILPRHARRVGVGLRS